MTDPLLFPADFYWGAATASYQIEGGWDADGKGESIWDRFSHTPGRVKNGDTGDVACDHYHRWPTDIEIMKEIGLNAYRFSIGWSRILPTGRGAVNQAGLDFYSRLVDGLLAAGITPFVTLYHWDLPQALQDDGGWPHRATAEAFAEYADVVTRHLGDRVKNWMTHNEMSVVAIAGHLNGALAPGLTDTAAALGAAHHLLLSHGWAVPVIKRNSANAEVGLAVNVNYTIPASASWADREVVRKNEGLWVRWYLDPIFGRHYPADIVADAIADGHLPPDGPTFVQDGDLKAISAPLDFVGLNYYFRAVHRDITLPPEQNLPQTVFQAPKNDTDWTETNWEVYADGLMHTLNWLHLEYQPAKMYVTENGASYSDGPDGSGRVHDQRRLNYLKTHFAAAHRSMELGVPLKGYFVWSLLDNFEWAHGFSQRFGLVWVDYQTQQRILKDSALWYKQAIASRSVSL